MIANITIAAPTAIPAIAPTPMPWLVVTGVAVLDDELDCTGTLLMAVPEADVVAAPPEVRDAEATVTVRGPAVAPRVMPRLE